MGILERKYYDYPNEHYSRITYKSILYLLVITLISILSVIVMLHGLFSSVLTILCSQIHIVVKAIINIL